MKTLVSPNKETPQSLKGRKINRMKNYMLQTDTGYKYEPERTDWTEDDIWTIKNSSTVHMLSWHSFVKGRKRKKRSESAEGGWSSTSGEVEGSEKKKELMDFLSE